MYIWKRLTLETLPLFLFISTVALQSLFRTIVTAVLYSYFCFISVVFFKSKKHFVWSSPYTWHSELKKKKCCQIGQIVKQKQADKENGSVFRGHFWWLTSQSLPVLWYWCVNGILPVETHNAIARVNSQATGKVNLVF